MATPQEVYIQDKNSGKVLQYCLNADYEVQIQTQSDSTNQKWLVTDSGVAGYIYIESKVDGFQEMSYQLVIGSSRAYH